jgi:WhiB family redox-sensing transcriptional regulator
MTASHQAPATLPNALAWAEAAACRGSDLNLFFSDAEAKVQQAKRICAGCPVRAECLDEGLRAEDSSRYGIYGGLTPDERTELVDGPQQTRRKRTGGKPLALCGTRGAYDRHVRKGEPIDAACQRWHEGFKASRRKTVP